MALLYRADGSNEAEYTCTSCVSRSVCLNNGYSAPFLASCPLDFDSQSVGVLQARNALIKASNR